MREGITSVVEKERKKPVPHLAKAERELVYEMFFGPYKPEWKNEKGIVDNRDCEIAKRMGIETGVVSAYTEKIASIHFTSVIKAINKK